MGWVFGAAMFMVGIFLVLASKRISKLAVKARSDHFAGGVQEADKPLFRTAMVIIGIGWMGLGVLKAVGLI